METTRELYYKKADAMNAAEEMLLFFGGWWGYTSADDKTEFNFVDEKMQKMCWSGELSAVQVYGCRKGMSGLFAWWEE